MNRLPLELDRLYGPTPGAGTRLVVLEATLPVGWDRLAAVWRGVQSDLELPAPAIAVSGVDGLQLWFSFASPVSPSTGARFLQGLRARYLSDVKATMLRLRSGAADRPVAPPVEVGADHWSAFITHDLAAIFAETPWLDIPPSGDGQAAMLRALEPIPAGALEAALQKLGGVDEVEGPGAPEVSASGAQDTAPARFLAGVMNDDAAPLALRIEAAAILLRHRR